MMIKRHHYNGHVKLNVLENLYKTQRWGDGGVMYPLEWIDILVEYDKRHFKDGTTHTIAL